MEIVRDEAVESLVRELIASFSAFGRVPRVAVFVNPNRIVIHRTGWDLCWHFTIPHLPPDYRLEHGLGAPARCTQTRRRDKVAPLCSDLFA